MSTTEQTTTAEGSVDERCAIMPDTFGPGLLGDTMVLPSNYTVMLSHTTDRAALERLLPPGIRLQDKGDPIVSYRFRRSEEISWCDPSCMVIMATCQVETEDQDGNTTGGFYCLIGWEDDPMAAILGRELGGTIKLHGQIDFDHQPNGTSHVVLHHRGLPLMQLQFRRTRQRTEEELAQMRANLYSKVIGYKGMPTVDGRELGEHYATEVPVSNSVDSAWDLEGSVTLTDTTLDQARWHHRAIQALRSLPVKEWLPGVHLTGEIVLDLKNARRIS